MGESREKTLEKLIWRALNDCTLPSPHKRGILNGIESRLRMQEQVEKNADKLSRLAERRLRPRKDGP